MTIRIGDTAFIRNGTPAVVKNRDEFSGLLTLDAELGEVQAATRHGFVNGLSPEDREAFDSLLDVVKSDTMDANDRVETLKLRLAEIESDPTRHLLAKYVRAEMMHIMNSNGIKPREYSIHESKAR